MYRASQIYYTPMASKVKLSKISRVASPLFVIGEDILDDIEIEDSMNKRKISEIDRLESFSSPMS